MPPHPPATQAYVGLAVLGWGLSILLGVVPHEDLVVGTALTIFGAILVARSRLPTIAALNPLVPAITGAVIVHAVVLHAVLVTPELNPQKTALLLFGLALVGATPFLHLRLGSEKRNVSIATLVACSLPVLGMPLLVWATQAAFKGAVGSTPLEAFIHYALLLPLAGFLGAIGLDPAVQGQAITYATPRGPLGVNVGAACSGIQAMALFSGVLALFLVVERPAGKRMLQWTMIGLLGVYAANLLRLAFLTMVGYGWGVDALLQVHAQAGWVFFVSWALLFAATHGGALDGGKRLGKKRASGGN
jgi:exosortase/archaeosortase family protein